MLDGWLGRCPPKAAGWVGGSRLRGAFDRRQRNTRPVLQQGGAKIGVETCADPKMLWSLQLEVSGGQKHRQVAFPGRHVLSHATKDHDMHRRMADHACDDQVAAIRMGGGSKGGKDIAAFARNVTEACLDAMPCKMVRSFDAGLVHPHCLVIRDTGNSRLASWGKEAERILHRAGGGVSAVPCNQRATRRIDRGSARREDQGATRVKERRIGQELFARQRAVTSTQHANVGDLHVVGKDIANAIGKASTIHDRAGHPGLVGKRQNGRVGLGEIRCIVTAACPGDIDRESQHHGPGRKRAGPSEGQGQGRVRLIDVSWLNKGDDGPNRPVAGSPIFPGGEVGIAAGFLKGTKAGSGCGKLAT